MVTYISHALHAVPHLSSTLLCSAPLTLLTKLKLDMTLTSSGKRSWISIWFFVSIFVIFWDIGYCFLRCVGGRGQRGHATKTNDGFPLPFAPLVASLSLSRPRSMPGGDLHWIWKPYSIYMNVDYVSHKTIKHLDPTNACDRFTVSHRLSVATASPMHKVCMGVPLTMGEDSSNLNCCSILEPD